MFISQLQIEMVFEVDIFREVVQDLVEFVENTFCDLVSIKWFASYDLTASLQQFSVKLLNMF